jgi:hypothetical protein
MAVLAWVALPSATSPIFSPVAGLKTGNVFSALVIHSPLIYMRRVSFY